MRTIRAGVVGAGHLGYHHARLYAALEGATLVGVADTNSAAREKAAADFGAPVFEDVDALIDAGVEAVSVATPTIAHAEIAIKLLEAGVHVLVEKPIAPTLPEAEAIVAAARAKQRIVQVGHIERFNGAVLAVMDAIEHPRFIKCDRLSPFPMRGTDVSVVLDIMIHDLDIVLALVGGRASSRAEAPTDILDEIVSLDAVGVPVFSESEDIADVRLRFASGCVANITASRISMERMRKIRIFSDTAYVSTDYSAQEALVYRKEPGAIGAGENPMEHLRIEPLPVRKEEPLRLELASFLECVRDGKQPIVSGEDGVRALKLAQAIEENLRSHARGVRAEHGGA